MPVPVSKKQPQGKLWSRKRYSTRVARLRFNSSKVMVAENPDSSERRISRRMRVDAGSGSFRIRMPGPSEQLWS